MATPTPEPDIDLTYEKAVIEARKKGLPVTLEQLKQAALVKNAKSTTETIPPQQPDEPKQP